ncbi:MarR family winged helix-turn-helix transcriptional regulator [Chloroflexota bacterium]
MEPIVDITSDDEAQDTWLLLVQTRDVLFNARRKELDKYHISIGQASMLFAIVSFGEGVIPARLSPWVFRKPNTVSEIIKRMEKDGLVTTSKDLDKKNLVRVKLTNKGRQLYRLASKRESIHSIMSALSKEELQLLRSILKKLRNSATRELQTPDNK